MLNPEWFDASLRTCLHILLSTVGAYAVLIFLVRLNGLRTFSKMSSFDFAVTVATGSVFATILTGKSVSLLEGSAAFASLIGVQALIAFLRRKIPAAKSLVDNKPLLLMRGSEVLHANLAKGRITQSDLRAKLREANVLNYEQVRAVVLESTGDISVLHSDGSDAKFDPALLEDVRES